MGLSNLISKKAYILHKMQTGFLYHYAFLMLVGTTLLLGILQLENILFDFIDFRLISIFSATIFLFNFNTILKNL